MATTDQRSGFRLPWASDVRPGAPEDHETPSVPENAPDAEGATSAQSITAEATEMQETTMISDPRAISWPGEEPLARGKAGAPDHADSATLATAAPDTAEPDAVAPEAATHEGVAHDAAAFEAAPPAPARPRRENLLVTGLVRAMRDAATAARTETAARFADEAKNRIESIHAESAEEAAELRKTADADIAEIRDWSKAEMARIREETDNRIADRKRRLETEVEGHAARVEHRIERVQGAIAEFEGRMERFFEKLFAEEDPATLAGLAEQLPEPPSLDTDDLDRDVPSFPAFTPEVLDARGAAEAEAEAFAEIDPGDDEIATEADMAEAIADEDVARRLDAFTAHIGATETVASKLAVVGLVSVASIAGFKRALAKSAGVRSVTVASGPSGDFVFTVIHDPETDLRSIVPTLDGFAAAVTGDADGVLAVTASDPEGTH